MLFQKKEIQNKFGSDPLKFRLATRINELRGDESQDESLEAVIGAVTDIVHSIDFSKVKRESVLIVVEAVLDFFLPKIDLPGPDYITRPVVKKVILIAVKVLLDKEE